MTRKWMPVLVGTLKGTFAKGPLLLEELKGFWNTLIKSGDFPYFSKIYHALPLGLWFRVTLEGSNKAMGVVIWILTSESCWSKALESDGCCRCTWHHSPPHLCYEYPHWSVQVYLKYIYCRRHLVLQWFPIKLAKWIVITWKANWAPLGVPNKADTRKGLMLVELSTF